MFLDFGKLDDHDVFLDKMCERIIEKQPRILTLYMRCDADIAMFNIAKRIKEDNSIFILFGGPQSSLLQKR